MKAVRTLAKKLFAKLYDLPLLSVTNSLIKKHFPKFKCSLKEHWEMLILKLLKRDKKANKVDHYKVLQNRVAFLRNLGFTIYDYQFFLGVSCKLSRPGMVCEVGFSESMNSWYVRIGRNGDTEFVSLDTAIDTIINNPSLIGVKC
jgi:hypothetical protein